MNSKDFQNGFIVGLTSGGVVEVVDTTEMDAIEDLIDNSGVLEDKNITLIEKVRLLLNAVKGDITKNFLKSSDGFTLTDTNGIYLMPKEDE